MLILLIYSRLFKQISVFFYLSSDIAYVYDSRVSSVSFVESETFARKTVLRTSYHTRKVRIVSHKILVELLAFSDVQGHHFLKVLLCSLSVVKKSIGLLSDFLGRLG